jgi:hypothetical protein
VIFLFRYRYELRNHETMLATGHLSREEALRVGDRIEINGSTGIISDIAPILREQELRLVVRLEPPDSGATENRLTR